MTTPTISATSAQKLSALEKIKALQSEMEACKAEGIAELKALIEQKEQELLGLRTQLAELTGEPLDPESPRQRRKRGPNKPKEAAPEAQQVEQQIVELPAATEPTTQETPEVV